MGRKDQKRLKAYGADSDTKMEKMKPNKDIVCRSFLDQSC